MRDMQFAGIGIDIADISAFRAVVRNKKDRFLQNTFSTEELQYCFSYKDPAPHLAGTFAAKEALRKATGDRTPLQSFEIRRAESGKPEVWIKGRRLKPFMLSISHSKTAACAVALHQRT